MTLRGLIALLPALAPVGSTVVAQTQVSVPRPKLVVVIAIDQLRPDYLQRFRRYFTTGGFSRMLRDGANFTEAHYGHSVTQTCPGHAVILTGSHARRNGIVANSWYNAALRKAEYCAADTLAKLIGAGTEGRSPRNLLDSTVGDQLKRATAGRSRIIAVAGKDRSAVMLGGHLADAAYWTEDTLFVTSSYYMKEMPGWAKRFNASGAVTRYRGYTWNRLLPAAAYRMVDPDDVAAEENTAGMGRTFPHQVSAGSENFIAAFQASPFENEVIVDFALDAVTQGGLGQDEHPDLLALGFSANDLVGHSYGPDSHEVMDMTLRTDRLLDRFFAALGNQVDLDSVTVVLTSDHGVAPLPELFRQRNPGTQAGRIDPAIIGAAAERALRARFGAPRRPGWVARPDWVMHQAWPALYLNLPGLEDKNISIEEAERIAKEAVERVPGVERAFTRSELLRQGKNAAHSRAERSFHPVRSGNIFYELSPYLLPEPQPAGTTHGSPWTYDTHVPLLWFGLGIRPGTHSGAVSIADIAPTLALLLGIEAPAGSEGRVLREMMRYPADSTMTAIP